MARGIIRKIDELGRITLPREYRKTLDLKEKDSVGMTVDNGVIYLVKADKTFKGVVRKLDELGRYTLPIECRRSLGFEDNQKVDIYIDYPDSICVRKEGCCWCSSTKDLINVNGYQLCRECAIKVITKFSED